MNEELILVPEVQARRALRDHTLRLHGALRVLRLKINEDRSADVVAGYESYRPA